jgi:hypothetical protein
MSQVLMSLAYVSRASHFMTGAELLSLLAHSREFNQRHGVTGMLIYCDGSFFQVIEGSRKVLDRLYGNLLGDSRHQDLRRVLYQAISQREFADWRMAFKQFETADAISVPGFSRLLSEPLEPHSESGASEVASMIHMFRKIFDRT